MALETCAECSTRYAIGVPACPHCGSAERTAAFTVPQRHVVCAGVGCRYSGVERTVLLQQVALGVLAAPALLCAGCGQVMKENEMPKITVHGGPSNGSEPADSSGGGQESPQTAVPAPQEPSEPAADPDGTGAASAEPAAAQSGYDDLTVAELREECKRRGLPTSGTKAELLERLEENPEDAE